ncbi:hypothetical protein SAMD00019534_107210 [Acytostelium subglobosum LB1]|uniref:hypothetical protein n=1 Tax=Acytostelium subglobosum LB1 TaxID=1410327 RepID=UPI000644C5C2|nr:hypothetical protein SAMD00019534_107210 [Acytostelium subglobosum LB1]GAM27545.1 hypothetical protein SAMD00019534_107210 [Acytostelium subglobosum LB1]|eukprot:XP_012749610.1 hypothetical protein SAMD00019534_107210 [Acytostelium subglobosum LB1]
MSIAAANVAAATNASGASSKLPPNEVLMSKKGWEIAKSPIKGIFMNAFILWMIGSAISIFTMPPVIYMVIGPIKAILQTNAVFSRFEVLKREVLLMKLTYIAIQLGLLSVALYKCSSMGLLPITQSDWLSSLPLKINYDAVSGSQI